MSETGSGKRPGKSEEHVVQRATYLAQNNRAIRLSRHRMAPLMNFSKFHFITSLSFNCLQPFLFTGSDFLFGCLSGYNFTYANGPPSKYAVYGLLFTHRSFVCFLSLLYLYDDNTLFSDSCQCFFCIFLKINPINSLYLSDFSLFFHFYRILSLFSDYYFHVFFHLFLFLSYNGHIFNTNPRYSINISTVVDRFITRFHGSHTVKYSLKHFYFFSFLE